MKNVVRWAWAVGLTLSCAASAEAATAAAGGADNPWAPGAQWLTLRAGYAKSTADLGGDSGAGYGFAYSRMLRRWKIWHFTLFKQFSVGASVHHDVLSKFAAAAEIEVPATVELARHFDWHSAFHPYFGIGTGPVYRKTYRTGDDRRSAEFGYYFSVGGNIPVSRMRVLGADIRLLRVDAANVPANPVYGIGSGKEVVRPDGSVVIQSKKATHWSVKVGYSFAY